MDNRQLENITSGPTSACISTLKEFTTGHEKSTSFSNIDQGTKEALWEACFQRLKNEKEDPEIVTGCLNALRILSREKPTLEKVMTDERVKILISASGLERGHPHKTEEGLKAIFNMTMQSSSLQIMFISGGLLSHLVQKVEEFSSEEYSHGFQFFTLRTLFLITALCKDTAPAKVRNLHNGLPILTSFLEQLHASSPGLDEKTAEIVSELLKTLYNLVRKSDVDDDDLQQLIKVTRIVRHFFILQKRRGRGLEDVTRHSIDLLAALPPACFLEFVPEDEDMSSVEVVLTYLLQILNTTPPDPDKYPSPLMALNNMAHSSRPIRRYLKARILPPLRRRDVESLPEEGTTLRNKLVALLTSPLTHVSQLVAALLFVLCKENVGKMVKYTGYGNAAGLLANRGLMLGGNGRGPPPGMYSDDSDSGASDTEEYREVEHRINPIEGRIQEERPHPLEGMTEEQKEYETMKLINAIDKLERSGGIRPCRIGRDGRPEPIEHVCQLQDALENPMKGITSSRRDETDSDSD